MKTLAALARGMRLLRKRRGLTQAALAERVGVNVQFISQLERQERSPSVETLDAVADALEIPPWQLLALGAEEEEGQQEAPVAESGVRVVALPASSRRALLDILTQLRQVIQATDSATKPTTAIKRRHRKG